MPWRWVAPMAAHREEWTAYTWGALVAPHEGRCSLTGRRWPNVLSTSATCFPWPRIGCHDRRRAPGGRKCDPARDPHAPTRKSNWGYFLHPPRQIHSGDGTGFRPGSAHGLLHSTIRSPNAPSLHSLYGRSRTGTHSERGLACWLRASCSTRSTHSADCRSRFGGRNRQSGGAGSIRASFGPERSSGFPVGAGRVNSSTDGRERSCGVPA